MAFSAFVAHGMTHTISDLLKPVTNSISILGNALAVNEMPSVEAILDLTRKGYVDTVKCDKLLALQGVPINLSGQGPTVNHVSPFAQNAYLWNRIYYAGGDKPTVHDILTLSNRGILPDGEVPHSLQVAGMFPPAVCEQFSNLRFEIPGSSDLVRFSVRHVFEPDLVKKLGYNDEFRPILDVWHKFQGLNYPIFTGPFKRSINQWEEEHDREPDGFYEQYVQQGLEDPTWAQAYWWSHWVLPSAGQGYEMYFRLRPDRDRSFDPDFAKGLNFSLDDLNLLLRANDYPPYYRAALAAIAHRVPGIRFMRELIRNGVYTVAQVYDLLRRQGYSDGDAKALTANLAKTDRDARRKAIETQAHGQFARYYELGIISSIDYEQLLVEHGLTPADAAETTRLAETDRAAKKAQRVINYVKQQVISGKVDKLQAANLLSQAGVLDPQRGDYIEEWNLEVKSKHREISASQAIHLACKGLISIDELSIRLSNLSYAVEDVRILSAEAMQCAQERAATLASKAAKAEKTRQSDLIKAQKAAATQIKEARRALAGRATPAQLRKWYCEGHVGQAEVYERLAYLDWKTADISRLIADCKSAPSPSGGGPPSGGGGKPGP